MEQVEERFGEYILTDPLGSGGMGQVFKAYHIADKERVYPYALKRLKPGDADLTTAVLREAAIGRALRAECFVETYDVGQVDGTPYLLMEFIDGADLGRLIGRLRRRKRQMPMEVLLDLLEQMTRALELAHRWVPRGATRPSPVIHRDLKPQNILIGKDGRVKIADFGIARRLDIDADDTADRVGTLSYMSPEQIDPDSARPVGPAADVFALGAIAYELCALEPLFQGSEQYILQQISDPDPLVGPRLKSVSTDLHPELRRIIARCLRWDPKLRYDDAGELADDLGHLRERLGFRQGVLKTYMIGFADLRSTEAAVALTAGRKGEVVVALPLFRDRGPITGRHAEVIEFTAKRRLPHGERKALRNAARRRVIFEVVFYLVLLVGLWAGSSAVLSASVPVRFKIEAEPPALVSVSTACNGVYRSLQPTPLVWDHVGPMPVCALFERKGFRPLELEVTKEMAEKSAIEAKLVPEVCVEVSTDPRGLPVRVSHRWQPGSSGTQSEPLRVCGLDPGVPYLVSVKFKGETWDLDRFVGDPGDVVAVYRSFIPTVEPPKDPSVECQRRFESNRLEEALGYCQVAVAEAEDYLERLEAHLTQARIYMALDIPEEACRAYLFALDEAVRARDRRKESDLLYETRAAGCEVP